MWKDVHARAAHRLCTPTLGFIILSTFQSRGCPPVTSGLTQTAQRKTARTEQKTARNTHNPTNKQKLYNFWRAAFFFWPTCKKRCVFSQVCPSPKLDTPQRTICQSAATAVADLSPAAYVRSTPKPCSYTDHLHVAPTHETSAHCGLKKVRAGQKLYQPTGTSQNCSSPSALGLLWVQTLQSAHVTAPPMPLPTDVCISSRAAMSSQHFLLFITLHLGLCPLLLQDTKPYCIENY